MMDFTKKAWILILIITAAVIGANSILIFRMYQQQASWREVTRQDYDLIINDLETEQNRLIVEFIEKITTLETQIAGHEQVLFDTGQVLEQLTEENQLLKKKLH